ncbi:MAG: M20/M25/M40 family metallo-hydrolase, partial [Bacteroidales bacterium]|nr:M20/M25/M40 family metallo-hydrolase [Bacteroidales bacterium]
VTKGIIMRKLIIGLIVISSVACQKAADPAITVEEFQNHITYLASDELAGRYPGTTGDSLAADYIRGAFKAYGLQLLGDNGYQNIDIVVEVDLGKNNSLMSGSKTYALEDDYLPLSLSANKRIDAGVVFVGYGLVVNHKGFNYDNYSGMDVKDKLVMILEGGPVAEEGQEDHFSGYLSLRNKILTAQDHGAAGVIFVRGPVFDPDDVLEFTKKKELAVGLPVVRVKRQVANDFISESGKKIKDLEAVFSSGAGDGFQTTVSVSLKTDIVSKAAHTHNVLGFLAGPEGESGPLLIIGAHYDHLGMGGVGSGSRVPDTIAVHYGADDNASGVATIIELAGSLAAQRDELNCSILFIAFAGEEMGLIGSKYYVENPLLPLDHVRAMINLDMVGRLKDDKKIAVGGTGTAVEFDSLLSVTPTGQIEIARSPEGYGPSDHASFYSANLPVLYFSTGAHIDYHTPEDKVSKINFEGMIEVADIVESVIVELATGSDLTFQEAGLKQQAGAQTKFKVTLGIMPDMTNAENNGLRVEFATEGRPAQLAGMQKGDRIVKMNGLAVTNIYDYMTRLRTLDEGQTVTVEVVRKGEIHVLLVQL